MARCSVSVLKRIFRWQLIILLLSIVVKLINKYLLDKILCFVIGYPGDEVHGLLWWQKYSLIEQFGWYLVDYIEHRQGNNNNI